jgi:hypothetical protein
VLQIQRQEKSIFLFGGAFALAAIGCPTWRRGGSVSLELLAVAESVQEAMIVSDE